MAHPEIPHGRIRVVFTPDEEVGRGTEHIDVAKIGAVFAYTLDGGGHAQVECETFSADSISITFAGRNTHPGYAKGKMINSIKVGGRLHQPAAQRRMAARDDRRLRGLRAPQRGATPRSTKPPSTSWCATSTAPASKPKEDWLVKLAAETVAAWPGTTFTYGVRETYRNMREVVDQYPQVLENAEEAMRRAGLDPKRVPIRGGTDGSEALLHGPAHPQPLLRPAQHPLAHRMGRRLGDGKGGRGDRRDLPRLRREGLIGRRLGHAFRTAPQQGRSANSPAAPRLCRGRKPWPRTFEAATGVGNPGRRGE